MRGVAPRSRSHRSQTSGARRRCGQRWAGVTRSAANWAFHGRFRPLRHVTMRHARPAASARRSRAPRRRSCRPVAEHGQMRRNPERVGEPGAVEVLPQRPVVPEFRIAEHRGDLKAAARGLPQQRERQAPFLLEPQRRGDLRALPRLGGQPRLGHVQRRPQHPGAHAGPQRRGHRDLAVGDLAQRPAVLARDRHRVPTLLREARAVENQHARALGDHRPATAARRARRSTAHA